MQNTPENLARIIKIAASGERPHSLLPGRTSKTQRHAGGTLRPAEEAEEKPAAQMSTPATPVKAKKSKRIPTPKIEVAVPQPAQPKVDVQFSIKLGEELVRSATDPQTPSTGAQVNGSFAPSVQVSGDYGHSMLSNEQSLMQTPVMPGGNAEGVPVMDVKVSSIVDKVLEKIAVPQPLVPEPDDTEPPRTQPAATPKVPSSSTGETVGLLGGAAAGTGLGAALARKSHMTGPSAIIPIATGAAAGAGLGGLAGRRIGAALQPKAEPESLTEEQALQQLLQTMQRQNPQFYERMNTEEPE